MEASTSSVNIATFMLIGIVGLVIVSLLTLAVYLFGGSSPLERNAKGRIEAALNPADVLNAHRQHGRFRLVFALGLATVLYWVLYRTAPIQTQLATTAFVEAVSVAVQQGTQSTQALLRELGIGNE